MSSLPFPVEEDKEGQGDSERRDPGHPGTGKGLSREQKKNKELVKEMMLSLDVEDGLDEIHTFRLVDFLLHFCSLEWINVLCKLR